MLNIFKKEKHLVQTPFHEINNQFLHWERGDNIVLRNPDSYLGFRELTSTSKGTNSAFFIFMGYKNSYTVVLEKTRFLPHRQLILDGLGKYIELNSRVASDLKNLTLSTKKRKEKNEQLLGSVDGSEYQILVDNFQKAYSELQK